MQLLVAIQLDDDPHSAHTLVARREDRPALPAVNQPQTTFVAQLYTSWLGLAHTRARKRRELVEMNDSYTATSRLSPPDTRMLDRSV